MRAILASTLSIPMFNNRRLVDEYRTSVRGIQDVTADLVDRGVLVPIGTSTYGQAFCQPDALDLLSTSDDLVG
ncbi:hypothetical protein Acsp05_15290 [Actinokineospora sp. NBRC 105648]|nr:hypothetical protein Acsp05_15290 [Actinokineospora sp. NBRC 105648]